MSPFYLFKLNYSIYVAKCIELPFVVVLPGWFLRSQLLEPMCLASKGSVEASFLALNKGWAINLGGGFHHANKTNGEGFCIYPDITFIVHYLRKVYNIKKIMIVDFDAH